MHMKTLLLHILPTFLFCTAAIQGEDVPTNSADAGRYDQSDVPLEEEPPDASLAKIVIVAGKASHGPGDHEFFAGSVILSKLLAQTPGVFPVLIRDGWPKNEKVFSGAQSIVFYLDGSGDHPMMDPAKREVIRKEIDRGCGYVNLHYALEYTPETAKEVLPWIGGYYEPDFSINPRWSATFKTLPVHPVTRGVKPFRLHDEWYYNMRWMDDASGKITPLLTARPPDPTRATPDTQQHMGRDETVAWAFDRGEKGRGFGFTGGHIHANWGVEPFRRIVVNGILWTAGIEIPTGGAKVELDTKDLDRHLDLKERGPKPIPREFAVNLPSRPITDWQFIGPFSNEENIGFNTAYPVETSLDLSKSYPGKGTTEVKWRKITTDPAGTISTYELLRDEQEKTVSYFFTEIDASKEEPVNFGFGSDDGIKVWLNGALIHANDAGRGLTQDEDAAWGTLKKGKNTLLVKLINGGGTGGLIVTLKCKGELRQPQR